MIDQALTLIRDRLNAHLCALCDMSGDLVVLAPLSDAQGHPTGETRNRLALFLTHVAPDAGPRIRPNATPGVSGEARPLHLDIHFMLAAGHDPDTYGEGLKLLSAALLFFQAQPVLTPTRVPEMPAGILQLAVDISNLRIEEVGQLWSNLGGRYVPSVMFAMRSVMVDTFSVQQTTRPGRTAKFEPDPADGE